MLVAFAAVSAFSVDPTQEVKESLGDTDRLGDVAGKPAKLVPK